VWEGESFEVTERGKAVGRLVPLPERASAWDRLIADGKIVPARRPLHPLPKPLRRGKRLMSISEALELQRDESPRLS
jgi:antitoxin (DNA-binding transcriptional repressor) of toxin-antitoxin stability system